MNQYIFHIGMHKCASTTLQNNVFKHEPGAIGTYKGLEPKINFGKQFQRLSPVGGRQFGSMSGVKNWIDRVQKFQSKVNPGVERFIVSSEFLCQSNKLSKRPIIKFLEEINNKIFNGDNIKIIIVFRNQAEMMASEYAQNSAIQYNSSQKNFEKWVAKRLNNPKKTVLDWGEWVRNLIDTFGRENVCILLLEEMQNIEFWQDLVSFIDARKLAAEKLHYNNTQSKKNTRKIDKKTWALTPFDLPKKAKNDINKIKHFMSGIGLQGVFSDKIVSKLITLRIMYLKLLGYKDKQLIDSEISISPEIESNIHDGYKDSNDRLSSILGRDISELGY